MNGFDLYRKIRENNASIPIAFITEKYIEYITLATVGGHQNGWSPSAGFRGVA